MRIVTVMTAIFITSACIGFAPSEPWVSPDQSNVTEAQSDCSGGESCIVLELGCCDSCNGGAAVAVNASSASEVTTALGETCDGATACTEMGCAPLTAECQAETCVLIQGSM